MMQVMTNLHSAHMDPDEWDQPQQFRPERFLDESGNVIGRDRVLPFGLGISTKFKVTFCVIMFSVCSLPRYKTHEIKVKIFIELYIWYVVTKRTSNLISRKCPQHLLSEKNYDLNF